MRDAANCGCPSFVAPIGDQPMDADGPHRFRNVSFGRGVVQAPGGASGLSHSETRCAAFAGAGASSPSTTCRFRESIPHPVQPLSTLRTPRCRDARKTRSRPACSALDGPDFHWQAHSSFPIAPRIRLSDKTSRFRVQRHLQLLNHLLELIGFPISRSFTTYCVCLELRSLPSTGVTRLPRYYEPLRHPRAPSLSLTGFRLVIADHALGLPVFRALSLCTCRRHYPGAASERIASLIFIQTYQSSPKGLSGRPAHCPFRGLLGVHSRCGLHTLAVNNW